jgi:hypothetical protein
MLVSGHISTENCVVQVEDWWSISKDVSVAEVKAGNQCADDSLGLVRAGHYSTEDSVSRNRLVRAQRTPRPG